MSMTTFDQAKADAFSAGLVDVLNHAALGLMLSIGHRTGLFDSLRDQPPATSAEIAARAGLHERYVREWLGAMAAARVLTVDEDRFALPVEHAPFVCRGADNIAVFGQYLAVLGAVEDDVVECFRKGGGVPYDRYPRFHAVMAEESGLTVMAALEPHILPLVPGLRERLQTGIAVLDAGCGSGRTLSRLAELFPASSFTGYDLSEEAVSRARAEAAERGLSNVAYEIRDLRDFDETAPPERFDFVTTFDAVHDQAHPLNLLKGLHRALKAGGAYLMQDIRASSRVADNVEHPMGTFLYTISTMHCMTVSLAQGGDGLGAMWGEQTTLDYLRRAGFSDVQVHRLPHDAQNNWYVARK